MTAYQFLSYKQAIRSLIDEKKTSFGQRFSYAKVSEAAQIQKTYLSKVVNHDAHLTSDQLFAVCDYLGLPLAQIDYLLLLLERDRSSNKKRQRELTKAISKVHTKSRSTESHLKLNKLVRTDAGISQPYYLDPYHQVFHMAALCTPQVEAILRFGHSLGLSETRSQELLLSLQKMGILSIEEAEIKILSTEIHLPASDDLHRTTRRLYKNIAADQAERLDKDDFYSFSVFFSGDAETEKAIRERFFTFLSECKSLVKKAPSKRVYQMNFDLLPWGSERT